MGGLLIFIEISFSKGHFCKKKYKRNGHFGENGDNKGLLCKIYYKKGRFGEKCKLYSKVHFPGSSKYPGSFYLQSFTKWRILITNVYQKFYLYSNSSFIV